MEGLEFYTVDLFQVPSKQEGTHASENGHVPLAGAKSIKEFPNMISARVIEGKTLELEHSKLVGPAVKFKSIINYKKVLEEGTSLGFVMTRQGYISKLDDVGSRQ